MLSGNNSSPILYYPPRLHTNPSEGEEDLTLMGGRDASILAGGDADGLLRRSTTSGLAGSSTARPDVWIHNRDPCCGGVGSVEERGTRSAACGTHQCQRPE
jgi:hypothetical protein